MRAPRPATKLPTMLATLVVCAHAAAQEPTPAPDYEITVKPRLCIVDRRTPACEPVFRITWRAAKRGYYCVLTEQADGALRCWPSQTEGQLEDTRRVSEDLEFTLNRGEDGPVLASATVEVLEKGIGDRRRRRRTRYVWDVL